MKCSKDGSYCSMWQIHGMASVLGVPITSIYPCDGYVKQYVHRTVQPRITRMGKRIIRPSEKDKCCGNPTYMYPKFYPPSNAVFTNLSLFSINQG